MNDTLGNPLDPPQTYVIGSKTFALTDLSFYQTSQIIALLTRAADELKLQELLLPLLGLARSQSNDEALAVALTLLPRFFEAAPQTILRAVALALVPAAELEALFKSGPAPLNARLDETIAFLNFYARPHQPLELANLLIPHMGLDDLKNALTPMARTLSQALGANVSPTPTPSSDSSSPTPTSSPT